MTISFRRFGALGILGCALLTSAGPSPASMLQEEPPPTLPGINVWHPGHSSWQPQGDSEGDETRSGNQIVLEVWWYEPGAPWDEERSFGVIVEPSYLGGSCSNSGESTDLPDFAIESGFNPNWMLQDPDLPYPGQSQGLVAESIAVRAEVHLTLIVTSYDWGGNCRIRIGGAGPEVNHDCPEDLDGNMIPDAYEAQVGAAQDPTEDQDTDARETPVHLQLADGLPYDPERRGFKRLGTVARTDQMVDAGGTSWTGGPKIKDVFFTYQNIHMDPPPIVLFPADNDFLFEHGIVWHSIRSTELAMPSDGTAGFVYDARTGTRVNLHRSVWLRNFSPITGPGGLKRLGQSNLSLVSGVPVDIDTDYILQVANALGISYSGLLKWTVAHELAHKLSLQHNEGNRTYQQGQPPANPDYTKYYTTSDSHHIMFWSKRYGTKSLELLSRLENAGSVKISTNTGNVTATNFTVNDHGITHAIGEYHAVLSAGVQVNNPLVLVIEIHLGQLMDPVPHPDELETVEDNPLTTDQEREPKVMN